MRAMCCSLHSTRRRLQSTGFTLIELLVTIAVLAIVAALGAPSLQRFMPQRAVASQVDAFTSAIRLTRSEALKAGSPVTMCMSITTDQKNPTCAANADSGWGEGWLVFIDRDDIGKVDDNDEILRVQQPFSSTGGITSIERYVTFQANGISLNAASTVKFKPKPDSSSPDFTGLTRSVCVSKQGRARSC
jgi:type IV fimbrial biogenesis protein FimT